ncbi:MAG: CDP-alcohol phosphatidyltransferase family protein [Acidimicrobiia bacterium]
MEPTPSDRIVTLPNAVSFARLLGVGVFWWVLVVDENIALAAWLIFIIGWTDWIDGYLARKLNQVTKLGKALDPVADRLMIVSAVVGGLIVGVVPAVIAIPLLLREALMGVLTVYLAMRGGGTLEVRYLGKAATFALYGAIPAFYLAAAGFLEGLMLVLAWFFGFLGLILYWYVLVEYVGDVRSALPNVKSLREPDELTKENDAGS